MEKTIKKRFGLLEPKYKYQLNPYPELKFNKCPNCNGKTGQRKLPLVIYINQEIIIVIKHTHRYCQNCDTLIGHKHEIEQILFNFFSHQNPQIIGNSYVLIGTVEIKDWPGTLNETQIINIEALKYIHDLKTYNELRMTMGGWFFKDDQPPVMKPPASAVWVKHLSD